MIPKGPFDVPSSVVQPPMREVPTGPEGATIADKLVERETSSSVIAPDEFDDSMAHQEVADEHQRMRRKFIHREGGFLKEDESVIQPLDEADGGEPLSRFKAARLSGQ
jgi:unconventional prefoldin RPB5 interactor 1